jgi:hypothetical protein
MKRPRRSGDGTKRPRPGETGVGKTQTEESQFLPPPLTCLPTINYQLSTIS